MSKLMSLRDAIRLHVHDGDLIYAAGFTHLIPFAAGHEIIRQGKKNLTLIRPQPLPKLLPVFCANRRSLLKEPISIVLPWKKLHARARS